MVTEQIVLENASPVDRNPPKLTIGNHWSRWLFAVLLLVHVAPLWVIKYFPTQDGPSHVYNSMVLKEYHKHENYRIRDLYKLNIRVFPNWTSHLLLSTLLYVVSPQVAEKILLTVIVVLIPASYFYFLDAIRKGGITFGWLGFTFSYSSLLFMGFYNFTLSVSLFFFTLGFWWKHRNDMRPGHVGMLYLLLIVLFASHFISFSLVLIAMAIITACSNIGEMVRAVWPHRGDALRLSARLHLCAPPFKSGLGFIGCMLPMYFIWLTFYLQNTYDYTGGYHKDTTWLKEYFLDIKSLVYFTDWHIATSHVLLYVLAAGALVAVYYRLKAGARVTQRDSLLLVGVTYMIIFVKAPWRFGPAGWINDRIHIFILLMLASWLVPDMRRIWRLALVSVLVAIALVHAARTSYDTWRLSSEIGELVSGMDRIEPHSTFTVRSPDWITSRSLGETKDIWPFYHATAYYAFEAKDVVCLENYEANYTVFPVNYRGQYSGTADYVVAWSRSGLDSFSDLDDRYEKVHETASLKLFRSKTKADAAVTDWVRRNIRRGQIYFDMRPAGGGLSPGYGPVYKDSVYAAGGFGWVTSTPRQESTTQSDGSGPDRDYLWATNDAAFRIDLPNGRYNVALTFFSPEEQAGHEIGVLANDREVIRNLIVPSVTAIKRDFIVEATTDHLTLVLFCPQRRISVDGIHDHWILNGVSLSRLRSR